MREPAVIRIDPGKVLHTMAGGAGASWHAIGPTAYWYRDLRCRANRNARGSAFGGNPPLEFAQAWDDLLAHARWLGLNFMRVEIDLRMYQPARGCFEWENEEMRTLYRILDYCERNGADVFLTQMHQDVEWNAFPDISRLQSAPKSLPDFTTSVAKLIAHLVKERKYTCIRWLCISNEPGFPACWWLGPDGEPASVMPAVHALRSELDRQGLRVPISGPDWCDMAQDSVDFDLSDPVLEALDVHHYKGAVETALMRQWADKAHARGVPFFISEFGSYSGDDPFANPVSEAPKSDRNQLLNAEKVIAGLAAGVDGFSRWSFVNRGDLDGAWQLVRTWNPRAWDYFARVTPESLPYYSYGILTRFMAKYSRVLWTATESAEVVASAIQSPGGTLTIYILNKSDLDQPLLLEIESREMSGLLWKYQVIPSKITNEYRMDPLWELDFPMAGHPIADVIPANSITVFSGYRLTHEHPGVIAD